MKVISKIFGTGTMINSDENNITVDFNGTVKTLVIKYARLTNEDGSPFGTHAVAAVKSIKKTNVQKMDEWKKTLTEAEKLELEFKNPDGTRNHKAYNDFLDMREKKARQSIGF